MGARGVPNRNSFNLINSKSLGLLGTLACDLDRSVDGKDLRSPEVKLTHTHTHRENKRSHEDRQMKAELQMCPHPNLGRIGGHLPMIQSGLQP